MKGTRQDLLEDLSSPSGKVWEENSGHRFLQKFHYNTLFSVPCAMLQVLRAIPLKILCVMVEESVSYPPCYPDIYHIDISV